VGQLLHLPRRGLDEPLLAEAERGAPEPGETLDIVLAVLVGDVDAVPGGDDERAVLLVRPEIGLRVEQGRDVPAAQRISYGSLHQYLLFPNAIRGLAQLSPAGPRKSRPRVRRP